MQFTTGLVSLVVAASGALALPSSSSLEARQDSRVVHARFFADGGCNGAVIGEQDFVQGSQPSCIQIPVPGVRCTLVTSNNATQTCKLIHLERDRKHPGLPENWQHSSSKDRKLTHRTY